MCAEFQDVGFHICQAMAVLLVMKLEICFCFSMVFVGTPLQLFSDMFAMSGDLSFCFCLKCVFAYAFLFPFC